MMHFQNFQRNIIIKGECICAGTFTTTLKSEKADDKEKHKYKYGYDLFMKYTYQKVRHGFYNPPLYEVYRSGVNEVPHNVDDEFAIHISNLIRNKLERDLRILIWGDV